MTNLSNDELVCLEIMNDGTNMLAIGRWKEPIEALAAKGYARKLDQFNHIVTKEGKAAFEQADRSQSDDTLRVLNQIRQVRGQAIACLNESAKQLAEAAECQHKLTGEEPNKLVWSLGQEIIKLALGMLK